MELSQQEHRRAFDGWLRTGRWPVVRSREGVELKFNPYHDPRNGEFTFAPGGSTAGRKAAGREAALAPGQRGPAMGSGANSRAMQRPMTLEQTFPGLREAPGGSIIALADNILGISGPADAAQAALAENWSTEIIAQIKAVDPTWRYDRLAPPTTEQGRINELNDLRWQRAAVALKVRGDPDPMKVETLRYIQQRTDEAYDRGLALLKMGKLTPRLSDREALGNYVDREVRRSLRAHYNRFDIDSAGKGPVRVNRQESDGSGTERTYRRPDARVADVAFDVTLAQKTLKTAQVRGFFNADFKPSHVVIIRPRQMGNGATYIISRPEWK